MISSLLWFLAGAAIGAVFALTFACEALARHKLANQAEDLLGKLGIKNRGVVDGVRGLITN